MKDLKVDSITHDLLATNFDLTLQSGIDRVVHNLKIRLWFFYSEWFLDTTFGVPYYESILVKNPDVPNIDSIIKSVILETADVNSLLSYESDYDVSLRKLTVSFRIDTAYGETDFTGVVA